jgi:hypothetical protein
MGRKALLACGILSSLLYIAMNVFVPMRWQGYSSASQTVSELSAIGAPTRPLWVPHQRAVLAAGGGTLSDTLHIVWTAVTSLFFILEIGLGAAVFGKLYRLYSIATLVILIAFGALTGVEAPNVGKNLPTPWIGIWERINIGAFMIWVIVLAVVLLRTDGRNRPIAAIPSPL